MRILHISALFLLPLSFAFAQTTPNPEATPPESLVPKPPAQTTGAPPKELTLDQTKTEVFYSQEVQLFLHTNPSWSAITAKVDALAKERNPAAFKASEGPFQRLSLEEQSIYRLGQTNASQSPEVQDLRQSIQSIQLTIEKITERLTPGYKEVKDKLQQRN